MTTTQYRAKFSLTSTNLLEPEEVVLLEASIAEKKAVQSEESLTGSKTSELYRLMGFICNPLFPRQFDAVIINQGKPASVKSTLSNEQKKFMSYLKTAIQVPDTKQWVNLSPYEPNRILPSELEGTSLGLALMEADLRLKRRLASLLNPQTTKVAEELWRQVREKFSEYSFETTMTSFIKVWVCPDKIQIYEHLSDSPENEITRMFNIPKGNVGFFTAELTLQVLCEIDRLALQHHLESDIFHQNRLSPTLIKEINQEFERLFKRVIIPIVNNEVNNSSYFHGLRQCFDALVLGSCFTEKFKDHPMMKNIIDNRRPEKLTTYQLKLKDQQGTQSYSDHQVYSQREASINDFSSHSRRATSTLEDALDHHFSHDQKKIELTQGREMEFQNIYYKEYLDLFEHGCSQSTHQEFDPTEQQLVTQTYFSGGLIYR